MTPDRTLRHAYELLSRPVVEAPRLNPMPCGVPPGMNEYERRAEAATLVRWCERNLTLVEMAYVRAQFGGERRELDMMLLEAHVMQQYEPDGNVRKGIQLSVCAYLGDRIGLRRIRKVMGCQTAKAIALQHWTHSVLARLHKKVVYRIYNNSGIWMQGK